MEIPRRPQSPNESKAPGDIFRLRKDRCGRQLEAVCRLVTDAPGWELHLEIAGSLQRSQVCRTRDEALETSGRWRLAMVEKGWS